MRFPNKITSFKESIISKFPPILKLLQIRDYDVISLYHELSNKMTATDYINALDCLYVLERISLENGVIHYVTRN